jgi:multidrug efflux pump subunit AcrA (membrane-fusion protein)
VPVNTLLFRNAQGVQAGVVEANGLVRLANVTVGRDYGTTVEIVHGLSTADQVILNPSDSLEPGAKVRLAETAKEASRPAHE